jgi:cell division protein FtsL
MVYRGTEAYDFSLFEPQVIEEPRKQNKSGSDKKRTKQPVRKSAQKKSKVTGIIDDFQYEVERDAKKSAVPGAVKKAMCFCAVLGVMAVILLVMQTKCDTLMSEIATVQNEIKIAESENVRLNAELNSLMASDKIENYAENVLGMVKAESYQISYIDLSEGDEVVVSGDKSLDDKEDTAGKIKALFAYIF